MRKRKLKQNEEKIGIEEEMLANIRTNTIYNRAKCS